MINRRFEAKENVPGSNVNERVLTSQMIELKREKALLKKEMRRIDLELQKSKDTILQLRANLGEALKMMDETSAAQNNDKPRHQELQKLRDQITFLEGQLLEKERDLHHDNLVYEIERPQQRNLIATLEGELLGKEDYLQNALCCPKFKSIELGLVDALTPEDNSRTTATQFDSIELVLVDAWPPEDNSDLVNVKLQERSKSQSISLDKMSNGNSPVICSADISENKVFSISNFQDVEANDDDSILGDSDVCSLSYSSDNEVNSFINDSLEIPNPQKRFKRDRVHSPEVKIGNLNVDDLPKRYVESEDKHKRPKKRRRKRIYMISSDSD